MSENESQSDAILGPIVDELLEQARKGEVPALIEYEQRHPELAAELRELFQTMLCLEDLGVNSNSDFAPSSQEHVPPSNQPKSLGEFKIVREIGRGGMGIVYEAIQESLDRHVAVKVLPQSTCLNAAQIQRFQREARSAGSLQHKNIVPVFGVGQQDGLHFYIMQYIEGRALDEILSEVRFEHSDQSADEELLNQTHGSMVSTHAFQIRKDKTKSCESDSNRDEPVSAGKKGIGRGSKHQSSDQSHSISKPISEVGSLSDLTSPRSRRKYFNLIAALAENVADGLHYAHTEGVLHRDIKPSNLLVDQQNQVWITDFGLAKSGDDDLTNTGDLIGTLRYMPPERLLGWSDPRSDVYSLGLTLYELATLKPAFESNDRVELLKNIQHDEPVRPKKVDSRIPTDLETIILKAISKEPKERYATSQLFADDLRRFINGRPIFARRNSSLKRLQMWCQRQPYIAGLVATVLFLLLTVAAASTFFAVKFNDQLVKVTAANELADQRLYDAFLAQTRASRSSTRADRRYEALNSIANAAELLPKVGGEQKRVLRDEMIACLSLVGIHSEVRYDSDRVEGDYVNVGMDANNRFIAKLNTENQVQVIDLNVGKIVQTFRQRWFSAGQTTIRLSRDGKRLAISGVTEERINKMMLIDVNTQKLLFERQGNWEVGQEISFSPEKKVVFRRQS